MGYYMGDYYAGDPGFFSFLGKVAKGAVGLIPGVGPAIKGALDVIGSGGARQMTRTAASKVGPLATRAGSAIMKHPVLTAAGAAGAVGVVGAARKMRGTPTAAGMATTSMRGVRGVGMRRHRRMNACNPKALRRAIRRTHSFAKLAMKTIHLVHPKKHVSFGGFKVRRRKK
jgi:hypothetical protein